MGSRCFSRGLGKQCHLAAQGTGSELSGQSTSSRKGQNLGSFEDLPLREETLWPKQLQTIFIYTLQLPKFQCLMTWVLT